jgi:iron-sulfur cluster repair protein YtfE (RIC family)
MPRTATRDTPAGKALAEHRALHTLLGEIERETGEDAGAAEDALVSHLHSLRDRLAAHFDGEEQSGLFEQIRELAPEQAHECARLCDEHLDLLRELDDLQSAEARPTEAGTWREGVRNLLARLAEHESKENELLNRVLDGSMEAQD